MIYVFKQGKLRCEMKSWDNRLAPNNSYILDRKKQWFHKLLDRVVKVNQNEVPHIYQKWALILV